ncbi:uncharacterized protein [Physcomitrium patens]|uniref:Uncharacterized protein n=1 Tax=Physcomitrium patens TaxID=3218 RepID=A0A2K1J3E5_PHYPA|nr:uncharacterized protein LOC112294161 isoform X1 [Physcomitrium patens]PNR36042.1 hypothetical protein PHYPA_021892 [Physcomitrium patens]|eukprot:XP_024400132.1 uncharacterized protein LOC112294161 isoform X1 [Physcomitrella patens]
MELDQMPPDFQLHTRLASCLVEINNDRKLKLSLDEWENNFKKALYRVEVKRERSLNVKNEVYQLIGFYSVFQGVVLGAVAQASTLTCNTAWGPALLSGLASIATVGSVHNKFKDYINTKQELKNEEVDANIVRGRIGLLKLMGGNFNFAALDERTVVNRDRPQASGQYYWPVMFVVVLFSIVVVIVVIAILCSGSTSHDHTEPQNLWPQGFT